jgi:hypothetical protein
LRGAENLILFIRQDNDYSANTWRISLFGDLSDEGTPGPIPNPEVKLVSADGTWRVTAWESRSLPKRLFISLPNGYFMGYNGYGKQTRPFGLLSLLFPLAVKECV